MQADELIQYLGPEENEKAVLSFIVKKADSRLELVTASLLIGPKEMAEQGWPEWRRGSGITIVNSPVSPAEFIHDLPDWKVGRVILAIDEATQWLEEATSGQTKERGLLPSLASALSSAQAPVQVFRGVKSPTSKLICAAVRPVRGFFFPDATARAPFGLDWGWDLANDTVFNAPYELLGIFVSNEERDADAPGGLLVGRVEQRAWIVEPRGVKTLETYEIHLGLDPSRIDIEDLEIEYEEGIRSDIIMNQRVRLEDVAVSDVRGAPAITIRLPSMGTKVTHGVRLRDREGTLLDVTEPNYIAETIHIGVTFGTSRQETVIGEKRPHPTLMERAGRLTQVIDLYRDWYKEGLHRRVFQDDQLARAALLSHLKAARGEVLVLDPFFGHGSSDWDLLRSLNCSIRVLTSKRNKVYPPSPPIANLKVRVWEGKAPFHDRFYLWDEGGLNVGTSPTGFERRFRMQRLGAMESEAHRVTFEDWWKSVKAKAI